jgi:nucleotide sugar dehydrogenase
MNIGILGQGFVGSAIREGLKSHHNILTYDLDSSKCNSNLLDVTEKSEIIFVCVPTPMRKDGSCDTRILESAIDDIYRVLQDSQRKDAPILVIKSTIPPGTTSKIDSKYDDMKILFSPEFLTEANSFEDFKNQNRIIIGVPSQDVDKVSLEAEKVKKMFRSAFKEDKTSIEVTNSKEAEMCKYFINCFLATKVIFANQMYDICNSAGLDYSVVKHMALLDPRIGKSHMMVPGPDGDRGFGGHCFPKDLAAMIKFGMDNGVPYSATFLQEVRNYNTLVRENKDWEKMKGRAVSED